MATSIITVDIKNMPEVIWAVRREMAKILREEADDEMHRYFARKLRSLANRFEAANVDE